MMATYFHGHGGSEIQAAGGGGGAGDQTLQTLYLMNPNLIAAASYSDAPINTGTPPNMLFLNPSNTQGNLPPAPLPPPPPPLPPSQQQQQFIGIPLSVLPHPSSEDQGRSSSTSLHHQIPAANLHALSVSRVHPNLWRPSHSHSGANALPASGHDIGDPVGFRSPIASQGLSLSLSPGMQMQPNPGQVTLTGGSSTSSNNNGLLLPGSKYLKAAQQLLDQVVKVGSRPFNNNDVDGSGNNNNNNYGDRGDSSGAPKEKAKASPGDQSGTGEGLMSHGGDMIRVGGEDRGGASLKVAELSTAQRQELQMKKAKLLNMLHEVEQRYRQYNNQMQAVVSSFEQAAGSGSAKLYTSLALKTISKQFRCLKDAIVCQIKGTSKSLGEEGCNNNDTLTGVKLEGQGVSGSRLRFVDHQLRQQRALQQLGMMQHNAWRPQRGLPERAVSVLRAWLFEHFLHPYPKDSDKHMLAKQTGLTRSQVSNWFINARVRLWKPMVEEMYLEEMKTNQEQKRGNNNNWEENTSTSNAVWNHSKSEMSTGEETGVVGQHLQAAGIIIDHTSTTGATTNDMISTMRGIGGSSDMMMGRSPKKLRSNSDNSPSSILSMDMDMKAVDHHQHQQRQHSMLVTSSNHGDADQGFNPNYMMNNNDMAGRPSLMNHHPDQMTTYNGNNGNAVSLTLGLPRCDSLPLGNPNQNFQGIPMARRLHIGPAEGEPDFCGNHSMHPHQPTITNAAYETIDLQNRKRFAAQILHDFVA